MKLTILIFAILLPFGQIGQAQIPRYFEFRTICGHGAWQDTTFRAVTSSQALADAVLAELEKPYEQRKFISGAIDHGHGGHNRNGPHEFLWHFIPDQWELVEQAIELCDGCPYSDVDMDTAYWIGVVGQFCPWSGKPVREVTNTVSNDDPNLDVSVELYPNPALDMVYLRYDETRVWDMIMVNSVGQIVSRVSPVIPGEGVDIAHLPPGIYYVRLSEGRESVVKKLVVAGK